MPALVAAGQEVVVNLATHIPSSTRMLLPGAWRENGRVRRVASLFGSLGETLARSVRLSNRKFREAAGWWPRYPSVREGFPAVVASAGWADGAGSSRAAVGRGLA